MKNKLAEEDQVRMIVWDVLLNLVKRLQRMNPKTFADLYDILQAIEDGKNENTRSARKKNYQTGVNQQGNTTRVVKIHTVQRIRRFSNFNQPLSKFLEYLV